MLCLKLVPSVCTVFVALVQCFRVARAGNVPILLVFLLALVPLVQWLAWSARAMCLLARVRTRTVRESLHSVYCSSTPCTAFPWASASNDLFARVRTRTGTPLCSVALGQHGHCTYMPVLVSLYRVTQAMYVSSCLDSHAVLVALLLLTWTVSW